MHRSVEVFGQRVTRKAKAEYGFTPEWEYFDLYKQEPFEGWPGSSMHVEFLTLPEDDGDVDGPKWEQFDPAINAVWNAIEDAIEERCKVEDAERRRIAAAQKSAPVPKPFSKRRH
jgi:hypothetical protein